MSLHIQSTFRFKSFLYSCSFCDVSFFLVFPGTMKRVLIYISFPKDQFPAPIPLSSSERESPENWRHGSRIFVSWSSHSLGSTGPVSQSRLIILGKPATSWWHTVPGIILISWLSLVIKLSSKNDQTNKYLWQRSCIRVFDTDTSVEVHKKEFPGSILITSKLLSWGCGEVTQNGLCKQKCTKTCLKLSSIFKRGIKRWITIYIYVL